MKAIALFILLTATTLASEYDLETFCKDLNVVLYKKSLINMNIANTQTTRTPEGGPYIKKTIESCEQGLCTAKFEHNSIFKYEPKHPDADSRGYVAYPNINILKEMKDLIRAQRVYEVVMENMPIKSKDLLKLSKNPPCPATYSLANSHLDYKSYLGR